MNFVPEQPKQEVEDVPYFDDVTSNAGWRGHTTGKSFETLKAEIIGAVGRLGGIVTGFQRGTFVIGSRKRDGFQMHYVVEQSDGTMYPGRMDIAALPIKDDARHQRSLEKRREKSLKMALFMLREALDGTWFLQQLSPGYAPLMPWMLEKSSGKTITQLWSESVFSDHLLPSGEGDFVEGEFEESL